MRRPVRVAHMIATNFFGGPEKQLIEHACRVDRERFALSVISFREQAEPNGFVVRAQALGLPTFELPSQTAYDNARAAVRLAALLRDRRIDILCAHGYKANVLGRAVSKTVGRPEVVFSRGWTGESRKVRLYEKLDRWCLGYADSIVAVSKTQRDKVLSLGVSPEKVSVVYNSIDVDAVATTKRAALRREFGFPEDAVIVAAAGRLSPEKNFGMLLGAAQLALKKDGRLRFIVFGEGTERRALEERRDLGGLRNRFLLPGFRTDLMPLIADADIFVLSSRTEGLPNVVLEACALQKPVVATSVGGTPEVVRHGLTGFLVAPDETKRMAEYIVHLAENRGLAAALGSSGREFVRRHFGFAAQTAQLEHLYGEVYASFYHHRGSGQK